VKSKLALLAALLGAFAFVGAGPSAGAPATQCAPPAAYPAAQTPVAFWSTEARCAIVPAGPNGAFGAENFGNKFPGEAAVYMGIVHVAIYDASVAIEGGYRPYLPTPRAPADTSAEAAVATAAYGTLIGLQPALGLDASQIAILDGDFAAYLADVPDDTAKLNGISVGAQAAQAVLASRVDDGRGCSTTVQDLHPPAPGVGVWQPNATGPVLGLCLPGMRPLALRSASQFRPGPPLGLRSAAYAFDFDQVKELGRDTSTSRTAGQTVQARFWTDHDIRQWNDGMLRLAAARGLDLVQTARMLAMAHVAGGDAMIGCFEAKYHYWFWRPFQAIPQADTDGNPATVAEPSWLPLAATPNFPEYPSAHACHSGAIVRALQAFFGTDRVPFSLESRITHTTTSYDRLHEAVDDVDLARVLAGFHFPRSDLRGSRLGRKVGEYERRHARP
jgi:hypothetical protein